MSRRKRRRGSKPPPSGYPTNALRKAGATKTRLNQTAAPTAEIQARRRRARGPKAVTTRWVEPDPHVKYPDAGATPKQLAYIESLASKLAVETPKPGNRREASIAIGRLRQLAIRRGEKDPSPRRRRAQAARKTKR